MRLHRLLGLLLLAACDGDPAGISPDQVSFTAEVDETAPPPEENVEIRVQNLGNRTLYVLDHCGDTVTPALERRQGAQWVLISIGAPCFAMVTPPIELGPGGLAQGSHAVHEPGHYRLRVQVARRPDAEQPSATLYEEFTIGS